MGNKIAEARREAFLPSVVEMTLITEKDHLVFGQGVFDRSDGSVGQVAFELDIVDLRADTTGKRANVEIDDDGLRTLKSGHGIPPPWRRAVGKILNGPIKYQCYCLIGVYRAGYWRGCNERHRAHRTPPQAA